MGHRSNRQAQGAGHRRRTETTPTPRSRPAALTTLGDKELRVPSWEMDADANAQNVNELDAFADQIPADVTDALIADAMSVAESSTHGGEEGEEDSWADGEEGEEDAYFDEIHDGAIDSHEREGNEQAIGDHDGEVNDNEEEEDDDDEEDEAEREAEMQRAREVLIARGFRPLSAPKRDPVLSSFDLRGVAEYIASKPCRNIVVMCGAGISVSAGIPDFRTPGTGLYDNLQKYDLPSPQSIFELSYFRERPDAFYRLCAELWPDNFMPTPTHHFLVELYSRGLLRRCFTQNIDSLEAAASMPRDMIVAAHGNFDRCSCIETGESVPVEEVRKAIAHGKHGEEGWAALSYKYGGLVKPDIVFFGEQLPERFFQCAETDVSQADLLIILGTSLKVQPFASLVGLVKDSVPRLLINREQVGTEQQPLVRMLGFIDDRALDFSEEHQYRDACYLGDCDAAVEKLCELLDEVSAQRAAADDSGRESPRGEPPLQGGWVEALQRRIAAQPKPVPKMPPADSLPPISPARGNDGGSNSSSEGNASVAIGPATASAAATAAATAAGPASSSEDPLSAQLPPSSCVGGEAAQGQPLHVTPPLQPLSTALAEGSSLGPLSSSPEVQSPEHKAARID